MPRPLLIAATLALSIGAMSACSAEPESSPEGAQGFHYLNPAFVDATVELLRPELVMYEPGPNGQLQLIGVDYIVPLTESATPPTLLGVPFARLDALGVWALHIWAWRPTRAASLPCGTRRRAVSTHNERREPGHRVPRLPS